MDNYLLFVFLLIGILGWIFYKLLRGAVSQGLSRWEKELSDPDLNLMDAHYRRYNREELRSQHFFTPSCRTSCNENVGATVIPNVAVPEQSTTQVATPLPPSSVDFYLTPPPGYDDPPPYSECV